MVEDEKSRNKNAVDDERYQLGKKTKNRNQPNQGTNRAPSISIYQPSPLDFTECSPPLHLPCIPRHFNTAPKEKKGKRNPMQTQIQFSFNARRD